MNVHFIGSLFNPSPDLAPPLFIHWILMTISLLGDLDIANPMESMQIAVDREHRLTTTHHFLFNGMGEVLPSL